MNNASSLPYRIALYFHNGPYAGRLFESQDAYIEIGSAKGSALVIPDPSIQPRHASITKIGDRIFIQSYGPYIGVNNKQVQQADLHNGDTIMLGDVSITCQLQIGMGVSPVDEDTGPRASQQAPATANTGGYPAQQPSRLITNKVPSLQPDAFTGQLNGQTSPSKSVYQAQQSATPGSVPTNAYQAQQPNPQASASTNAYQAQQPVQTQYPASPSAHQVQQPGSGRTNAQLPSVNPGTSQSPDDVTRYLCAAVHRDEVFREYVINHIFNEEIKAPGEAYGVDIVPVVRWAFAARQRTLIRDILLLVASPIIALVLFFLSRIFLGILQVSLLNILQNSLQASPFTYFIVSTLSSSIIAVLSNLVGFLFAFILFVIILVLLIARPFTPEKNRRWLLMAVLSLSTISLIVYFPIISVAWLIVIGERLWCYFGPGAKLLTRKNFRPDVGGASLDSSTEDWLRRRFPGRDGNLVVYSGYSPFAGSGVKLEGWSFVVDLTRSKANSLMKPQKFKVQELYAAQAEAIQNLGLKNLHIEDKLYANGKELRSQQNNYQQEILPNPFAAPRTSVNPAVVEAFKEYPTEDIRYYQCVKVTSWKSDLILSIFLRFYLAGRNSTPNDDSAKSLFIEGNYQLLTPVQDYYREIDYLATSINARRAWLIIKRTFVPTTFRLLLGPSVRLLRALLRNGLRENKKQQTINDISDNPSFDYGANTSLRELVSSEEYQRYFQRLDKEMYIKLIEYQVFETIVAFLDNHNIDASQFKTRQEAIINHGLMVTGGAFNANAMAFGEKSTINTAGNASSSGGTSTKAAP